MIHRHSAVRPGIRFRRAIGAAGMATIAVVALSACTPADSAEDKDIAGMKLGMSFADAEPILVNHPNTSDTTGSFISLSYPMVDKNGEEFRTIAMSGKSVNFRNLFAPKRDQDILVAFFTPPEEGHAVAGIYRSIGFDIDGAPSSDEIRQSIVDKYGEPVSMVEEGAYSRWAWQDIAEADWRSCAVTSGANIAVDPLSELIVGSTNYVSQGRKPSDVADEAYGRMFGGDDVSSVCGEFMDVAIQRRPDGTVEFMEFLATDYPRIQEVQASVNEIREGYRSSQDARSRPSF